MRGYLIKNFLRKATIFREVNTFRPVLQNQRRARTFWKWYTKVYNAVNPIFYNKKMRQNFVELTNPEAEFIIDLGCGTGYTTIELLKQNKTGNIIGIDLSLAQMMKAHIVVNALKENNRTHFIIADVEYLPLRSNVASVVISAGLVEFLPNPVKVYREMRRVSKKGGDTAILAPRLLKSPPIRVMTRIMMYFWTETEAWQDLRTAGFQEINFYSDGPKWFRELVLIAIAKK
ncbi:MAG: methyltransferase domain-containing protein [Candidatus Hodarchaeota archaeon]